MVTSLSPPLISVPEKKQPRKHVRQRTPRQPPAAAFEPSPRLAETKPSRKRKRKKCERKKCDRLQRAEMMADELLERLLSMSYFEERRFIEKRAKHWRQPGDHCENLPELYVFVAFCDAAQSGHIDGHNIYISVEELKIVIVPVEHKY